MQPDRLVQGSPYIYERKSGEWVEVLYVRCIKKAGSDETLYLFRFRPGADSKYVNLTRDMLVKIKEMSCRI